MRARKATHAGRLRPIGDRGDVRRDGSLDELAGEGLNTATKSGDDRVQSSASRGGVHGRRGLRARQAQSVCGVRLYATRSMCARYSSNAASASRLSFGGRCNSAALATARICGVA